MDLRERILEVHNSRPEFKEIYTVGNGIYCVTEEIGGQEVTLFYYDLNKWESIDPLCQPKPFRGKNIGVASVALSFEAAQYMAQERLEPLTVLSQWHYEQPINNYIH